MVNYSKLKRDLYSNFVMFPEILYSFIFLLIMPYNQTLMTIPVIPANDPE